MVIALFLRYRPCAVSRGYCGALIPEFLWPLGNLFTITGVPQARQMLECALGGLKAHAPLVWSTKHYHLPEIGSQVLPLKNRGADVSNSKVFSNLSSETSPKPNTENFFITAMNVSWLKTWIKHIENTIWFFAILFAQAQACFECFSKPYKRCNNWCKDCLGA